MEKNPPEPPTEQKGYDLQKGEFMNQTDIEPPSPENAPSPTAGMQTSMMEEEQKPKEVMRQTQIPTISMPPIQQQIMPRSDREIDEKIQELVEEIVEEKWHQIVENLGDLTIWKDKVSTEILSIKQEIIRTENRFENLQKAILGKVSEYGKGMTDVSTEIKALEQVLQKIIQPLSSNVKELSKITEKLKK